VHQPTTRVVARWRLIPFLLLAAVLHILAIITLPAPRMTPIAPDHALEVRLTPTEQLPKDIPPSQETGKPNSKARQIFSRLPPPTLQNEPEYKAFVAPSSAPPQISVESLLDSAKRVARDQVKRTPLAKKETDSLEDRPVLPGLAKAFRREPVGVTKYADGSLRFVTPSGKVYCARPLPDVVAHGGPVEPTVVATNCP